MFPNPAARVCRRNSKAGNPLTINSLGDQPVHVVLPGGPTVSRSEPSGLIVKPKFCFVGDGPGLFCPTTILPFRPGTTLAPADAIPPAASVVPASAARATIRLTWHGRRFASLPNSRPTTR